MPEVTHLFDVGDNIQVFYNDGTSELAKSTHIPIWILSSPEIAGWVWPIHYRPNGTTKWNLADGFGPRINPITHRASFHYGQDINGPLIRNTPILAAANGTVRVSAADPSYGNQIKIEHDTGEGTQYAHMTALSSYHAGDRVRMGDILGYVGSTGDATGPHLHYGTQNVFSPVNNTNFVDPLAFMAARGAPW